MSEERPAFYALPSGGWRDYWTLLHPPYTVWHLSYVAIGAAMAPVLNVGRLLWALLAFFLAVGLAAHALDELRGRPLKTAIASRVLWAIAAVSLAGAVAVGVLAVVQVSAWMIAFIVAGVWLTLAYNLELLGGRFHSDLWFAIAWGGFPALTSAFAQEGVLAPGAVVVATGCVALSAGQRALSTPVRRIRRGAPAISGVVRWQDGTEETVDAGMLRRTPEAALRLLAIAMPLLALGLVLAAYARR
jgi:hypothetical protein